MRENQTFNEMMVHVPLCTHKDPQNVLIVGAASQNLKNEASKHQTNVEFVDLQTLNSKNEKNIDVIILTDINLDEMVVANIKRVLKDDGLITFKTESFHKDEESLKKDLELVGENFWIAMPFRFGHDTAILASKKYHPTADIILQRSDLLNDLEYYSTEIHTSSFVFPASQHRALTGIAKR
ncbi:spermidine synthase [Halarcobacter ebronensis]|uniref:Spermidine synthase n=1 Tax=Halarcobacter ebronensis TaxID=1462615 RepID=A0A4V1LRF7_9BACT|nr:spermidine synthase [Halarcobacter ebronensis]RXJ68038.1 spermidine synthase [Halarcobacter ebronensis]